MGKKTAERIVLELADRVEDLAAATPGQDGASGGTGSGAQEAVGALVALGYSFVDGGTRRSGHALTDGAGAGTDELVRRGFGEALRDA